MNRAAQIDLVDDSFEDRKVNVIVVDDDEDDSGHVVSPSLPQIHSRLEKDVAVVVLSEHSPDSVKILLEYCYTNRVVSLGHNAFVQACKTRPNKHNGPVPPYRTTHGANAKFWPNNGIPMVTFSVALSAIRLAEEAGMYRLSFMCEISAAQLVTPGNVVEALTMSTRQKIISGNDLPRLRKAAMNVIFSRGSKFISEIGRSSFFKKALEEDKSIIVPTLLQGTMEAVTLWEKRGAKRSSPKTFEDLDKADVENRREERKRRRQERIKKDPTEIDEPYDEDLIINWADIAGASRRHLMAHHNMNL